MEKVEERPEVINFLKVDEYPSGSGSGDGSGDGSGSGSGSGSGDGSGSLLEVGLGVKEIKDVI